MKHVIAIVWVISIPFPVWAQCEPDTLLQFARELDSSGEHYRAITEYMRFISRWPDRPETPECRFLIGRNYMSGGRFQEAVNHYRRILPVESSPRWRFQDRYALSGAHYHLKEYHHSLEHLQILLQDTSAEFPRQPLIYSMLWCHIMKHDIPSALDTISLLEPATIHSPDLQALRNDIRHLQDRPLKQPWLAGLLSGVIPGAGQLYAGRWRDGVMSFVINGLFIGGTVAAIHSHHWETAAVLGFFELGWYSANIYNAMNDAHKTNRADWENHLRLLDIGYGSPFQPFVP